MATSIDLLSDLIALALTSDDAAERERAARLVPAVRQGLSADARAYFAIWLIFPHMTQEARVGELLAAAVAAPDSMRFTLDGEVRRRT